MDRTSEFFKIVDQRRSQESVVHPSRPPITRSEFTAEASEIGAAIYATADKLGKLTQLAKSKSLFEDPTAEINAMTGLIKTEIVSLNSKLSELKGRQRASRTKQRESHSTSVVESLSSQLRSATSDFKDVLHTRSANIKLLQDRRSQFSGFGGGGGGGSGGGAGSSSGCERSLGAGSSLGASAGSFGTGAGGYGAAGAVPVSIFECPAPLETCAGGSSSGGAAWPKRRLGSATARRPCLLGLALLAVGMALWGWLWGCPSALWRGTDPRQLQRR